MSNRLTVALRWLIAGTFAGGILGSVGIAVAQTDESTTTTAPSSSSSSTAPAAPSHREQRRDETPLTGDALEKAKAAALAAVPGATIKKAKTDGDGAYEVHLQRPDGTPATVKLDENFNVTGIEEGRGRGGCHHGGRGPGGPGGVEVTGETAERVKAAALAAVPGATVDRTLEGRDGGYVALVTKSDGTRAAVKLDGSFNVTSVEDKVGRPGGRGHRHGPPPTEGDRGTTENESSATPTNI